eukprot:SAG11_NODE_1395_length_5038_cov_1.168050_3_plen_86_part_00
MQKMIAFVGSQLAEEGVEQEGIERRVDSARLWIAAVGVEHVVLLMRVCVLLVMPSEPVCALDMPRRCALRAVKAAAGAAVAVAAA